MRRRPLVATGIAFALGIAAASFSARLTALLLFTSVVCAVAGIARNQRRLVWAALLTLVALFGALRFLTAARIAGDDVSRLPETSLTVSGVVEGESETLEDPHSDEAIQSRFVLRAVNVRFDGERGADSEGRTASGRLAVRVSLRSRASHAASTPERLPRQGDTVSLRGRLELPDGPRNPGGFDYAGYLAHRGIYATLFVRQAEDAVVVRRAVLQNPLVTAARSVRSAAVRASTALMPGTAGGILLGVLLSERHRIPPPVLEQFERTGTMHLLSTAGLHVGVVGWLIARALHRLRVPRKAANAVAILALCTFCIAAGERDAVVRATVVAVIYLIGEILDRQPDLSNALSIAALLLLCANPLSLFETGFQLSFVTVITIILLMPGLSRLARRWEAHIPARLRGNAALRRAGSCLTELALAALAAEIGSAPIVARAFYAVSFISLSTNVLVCPAVFGILALGFPMAALYAVHPALAQPFALALRPLVEWVHSVVGWSASLPFADRSIAPPSLLWAAAYYLFVVFGALCLRGKREDSSSSAPSSKRRAMLRILAACGVLLAISSCVELLAQTGRHTLRLTFLDVGQGDACVVESPGGRVLLVDTGGIVRHGEDDEGRRVVAPYLRYRGIQEIDAVVLSHPHADHIGGTDALLHRFRVGRLIDDGLDDDGGLVPRFQRSAIAQGTRLQTAMPGQTLDFGDGVRAEIIAPLSGGDGSANNSSVMLRLTYGRIRVLFTGDAEAPEEQMATAGGRRIDCDVLKVGHHGSRTSTTPLFLSAAHPQIAVISVGKRNLYGHPSEEVLQRLRDSGAKVYRTDRCGAVTVETDGAAIQTTCMMPPH